ncbi:uncharacterized protein BP5553_03659 [Venustampulla echinocandica]|uniref:DUF567-domain-containing protein n=1 Tax=Venustampulla echinocandica TaxID=2656787 RepID=A0A370TUY3_9HELO|nr:uncharacterized protein BP5553_03659 [Venustampulla echinocandica]RDL39319.1 hypothetical protein BP5553_03659 [Venustampulla echinocandica]
MSSINLPPISPALGLNTAFCRPTQTTLVLKEKVWSLSGDSFRIVDENGIEVVQCRGQVFSLSSRKEFADATGKLLFHLRQELFTIRKCFYGETVTGQILFQVKSKITFFNSKMVTTFTNASDRRPIELLVKGDWLDRKATITMGNTVVAQISRKFFNAREIFADKQTYFVTIAPGVDLALIAALCVCLDEKEND